MGKRSLITGITGQDGSYLAEFLLSKGYEVYGLVRRLSTPNTSRIDHILDQITLIPGDLTDVGSLMNAIILARPDEIYNLAAQSHVGQSFEQPQLTTDINGQAVINLLQILHMMDRYDIKFYQASTSELFGNTFDIIKPSIREGTRFNPQSPYANAKLLAHNAVQQYRQAYGMKACCGILFNHESPRRGLEFVTRKITHGVAKIAMGLADNIVLGNLDAIRDWGYAPDYVRAMWLMLQVDEMADYVIATGIGHSVRDFVVAAFDYANIENWYDYIVQSPGLKRPNEVDCLVGNATAAQEDLGWRPTVQFDELVKLMIEEDIRCLSGQAKAAKR